ITFSGLAAGLALGLERGPSGFFQLFFEFDNPLASASQLGFVFLGIVLKASLRTAFRPVDFFEPAIEIRLQFSRHLFSTGLLRFRDGAFELCDARRQSLALFAALGARGFKLRLEPLALGPKFVQLWFVLSAQLLENLRAEAII